MIGGGLSVTRSTNYALRGLVTLAADPTHGPVTIRVLARRARLPAAFFAKIAKRLVQAGLLRSRSGARGGLTLGAAPSKIGLLAILEAVEGPLARRDCFFDEAQACRGKACPNDCWLRAEERRVRASLGRLTLAQAGKGLEGFMNVRAPAARNGKRNGTSG